MTSISLWGDSIGKGVVFDEARGRYVILRENCVALLSRLLNAPIDNHAMMGCTARKAAQRMTDGQMTPGGVAVLEFGGNDCDMPWREIAETPEQAHRPDTTVEEFRGILTELVERVRAGGMQPLLVTPPPLIAERYFKWVTRGLNGEAVLRWLGDVQHMYRWQERYAAAVRDVARRTGARLIDLRDAFLEAGAIDDYYCLDGIHPNEKGHKLICRAIAKQVGVAAL